jgi:hypothetical protein
VGRKAAKERPALPPIPDLDAGPIAGAGWLVAMDRLARDGDERAAAAIRDSVRERPDLWQEHRGGGAIARQAEDGLVKLFGTDAVRDAYPRAQIRADLEHIRADLMQGSTDPLDALMVSRVLCAHIAASHADALLGQVAAADVTMKQLDWQRAHADRATRAFWRACESLARVRRMRGPAVAIAVGSVNVTTAAAAAPEAAAALPEAEVIEAGWWAAEPSADPVPAPVPARDR